MPRNFFFQLSIAFSMRNVLFLSFLAILSSIIIGSQYDGSLFAFHVLFMTASFFLFSTTAILIYPPSKSWSCHVNLQIGSLVFNILGYTVMFQRKNLKGKSHFWSLDASWHAWIGGFGLILSIILFVMSSFSFTRRFRIFALSITRKSHVNLGVVAYTSLAASMISGWYKRSCKPDCFAFDSDRKVDFFSFWGMSLLLLCLIGIFVYRKIMHGTLKKII